jgi:hypothetical protein
MLGVTVRRGVWILLRSIALCERESLVTDNGRHRDLDPFVPWALVVRAVALDDATAQTNRPCDALPRRSLGLAEAGQS